LDAPVIWADVDELLETFLNENNGRNE